MKTLILFRHGKSDWSRDSGDDHERPINKRGRKAARAMGWFLRRAGQLPDRVLASTALRAQETLRHAAEAGEWPAEVESSAVLYEARAEQVLEEIRRQDERIGTLLLVGHEPTWSGLLERFTGARVRFPTACMARVDLDVAGWSAAAFGVGTLIWLVPPKLLTKGDFEL